MLFWSVHLIVGVSNFFCKIIDYSSVVAHIFKITPHAFLRSIFGFCKIERLWIWNLSFSKVRFRIKVQNQATVRFQTRQKPENLSQFLLNCFTDLYSMSQWHSNFHPKLHHFLHKRHLTRNRKLTKVPSGF